MYIQKEEDYL